MHGKSYHIEVNHWHLKRLMTSLYDCQEALEETSESRRLLNKADGLLTCLASELFTRVQNLDDHFKCLIEESEKSTALDTSEEIADNLEKHIKGTLTLKSTSEDE